MSLGLEGGAAVLAALRRPGDEARWTQTIAAVAQEVPEFAPALARLLLARDSTGIRLQVPDRLECRAEVTLYGASGQNLGRVDLVFESPDRAWVLLVELKLHSGYGVDQLDRYRRALDALGANTTALVAVTTSTPFAGEGELDDDPRWLGSLRWADLYDDLIELVDDSGPERQRSVRSMWRAALAVLKAQGDFGPMTVDIDALRTWGTYRRADDTLRTLLRELVKPTQESLGRHLGSDGGAFAIERPNQPVIPWRLQPHLAFHVPVAAAEERFRVQFVAIDEATSFTVEARYQHPKEAVAEATQSATENLVDAGFYVGNDGYGHYWARVFPLADWASETGTLDRLIVLVDDAIKQLVDSGIFDALERLTPQTPVSDEPEVDGPVDAGPGTSET